MTWTELQQFINSLTKEQLQQNIVIRDNYGDSIHTDIDVETTEDSIFYDPFGGIIEGKQLTAAELVEAREDASLIIEPNTPHLVIL